MCAASSKLQNMNFHRMEPDQGKSIVEHGIRHLEFCVKLYRMQHEQGEGAGVMFCSSADDQMT